MSSNRQVVEGMQYQGVDEILVYSISASPAPLNVIQVKVFDETQNFLDVTATVMPAGSASINGSAITLPALKLLTDGHVYRVEVLFSDGTNTFEPYFRVRAER